MLSGKLLKQAAASGAPDSFILAQTVDEDGLVINPLQFTSDGDETSWVERSMTEAPSNSRRGLAYDGSGTWVSVGDGTVFGTVDTTYTSTNDGATWTSRTTAALTSLDDVTYGASLFVAVGSAGAIETSPDGITWTERTSGSSEDLYCIHWTGSAFIVGGESGTILTSANGITWSATAAVPGSGSAGFHSASSNGSRWFVGSDGSSGTVRIPYYSDDSGATWTAGDGGIYAHSSDNVSGIATNGAGTVVSVSNTTGLVMLVSTDNGVNYSPPIPQPGKILLDVIYDHGATTPIGFVVGGWTVDAFSPSFITTSPDGSTWTTRVNTSSSDNGVSALCGKNMTPP